MATPEAPKMALAQFKTTSPEQGKPPVVDVTVKVQFNPASLQYTVSNTLKDQEKKGGDKAASSAKKQYVSQSSSKLSMEVVFDTTDTGEDVRKQTREMAKFVTPVADAGGKEPPKVVPMVEFSWGAYSFTGLMEEYKETIDFFSADGVPLRATINLSLSSQEVTLANVSDALVDVQGSDDAFVSRGGSAFGLSASIGDPRAARAIAGVNASASLRFGDGGDLAVGASVTLSPAAAFSTGASAGAGFGAGIGGGLSIGGGVSAGISGGASAGVSAGGTASAFAGLRSGTMPGPSMPSSAPLLRAGAGVSVGSGAQFGLGGVLQTDGGAGLGSDVGASARFSFDS